MKLQRVGSCMSSEVVEAVRVMMAWVDNGRRDCWERMKLEPSDKVVGSRKLRHRWDRVVELWRGV